MRERVTKVCLVCFALVVLMSLPGQASAQVPAPAAPQVCSQDAPSPEVAMELLQIFKASNRMNCYSAYCRTNADCAAICPDVAKCCAEPSCEGGGPGGGWGMCVLM